MFASKSSYIFFCITLINWFNSFIEEKTLRFNTPTQYSSLHNKGEVTSSYYLFYFALI